MNKHSQELVTIGREKTTRHEVREHFKKPIKSNEKYMCKDFIINYYMIYILFLFLGTTSTFVITLIYFYVRLEFQTRRNAYNEGRL